MEPVEEAEMEFLSDVPVLEEADTVSRADHTVFVNFLGFNQRVPVRRWWSVAASTPLFTLTSWRDLLNFLLTHMWFIWF